MATREQEKELRDVLAEKFASGDDVQIKEAAASIDKFIRTQFTEQSFIDKIIEPIPIGPNDLHPSLTDDKPHVLMEIEPDMPGAASYAFNSVSPMVTMGVKRVLASLDRIISVRMSKDIDELLTHTVSLRDLNCDYLLKEILYKFDGRGLGCVQRCIGKAPGTAMAATGAIHYHEVNEGITSHSLAESLKIIPRLGTQTALNTQTILMNTVSYQDFAHWHDARNVGDSLATDVIKNGLSVYEDGVLGLKIITTIKRRLVRDGAVFHFADPKYIGQTFVWREPTLHVSQMDHAVSFYVDASRGGGIYFTAGLARVDHKGV